MLRLPNLLQNIMRVTTLLSCSCLFLHMADLSAKQELPLIGVDGAGNVIAVWAVTAIEDDISSIQVARQPSGGTWSAPMTLSAPGANSICPKLAICSAGVCCAAWIVKDPVLGIRSLYAAILTPGSTWGAATMLSTTDETVSDFSLEVCPMGNVVMTWNSASITDNGASIKSIIAPLGSSWGAPTVLMKLR